MIKEIEETLKAIENHEEFCTKHNVNEEDFYPAAHGYLEAKLEYLLRKIKEN